MLMPEVYLLYLLLQLKPTLLLLGQLLIKGDVLILKRFYLSFDLGPHLNLVIASFSQVKFRLVSFTFQVFIFWFQAVVLLIEHLISWILSFGFLLKILFELLDVWVLVSRCDRFLFKKSIVLLRLFFEFFGDLIDGIGVLSVPFLVCLQNWVYFSLICFYEIFLLLLEFFC